MTELHAQLLAQLTTLRKAAGLSIKQWAKAAGFTPQAYDKWRQGTSPKLEHVERASLALNHRLELQFIPMSEAHVSSAVLLQGQHTEELNLSPEALDLAHALDEVADPEARRQIVFALQGMITMARIQRPHEPAAEEPGHRSRRR